MKVKNSISTTMRTLKGRETKDKAAKNIFSYKPIMGNILKYTVAEYKLSLIHISEPTRQAEISYAVFCLKKKNKHGGRVP